MAPFRKIETDSSTTWYGGHDVTNVLVSTGMWLDSEKKLHINYLELKAVFLSLQAFCVDDKNRHIHIFIDNMVALRYLMKIGGRKPDLNKLAREIWTWCEERSLWFSAFFIPGIDNLPAYSLSCAGKKLNKYMEWGLDQSVSDEIQVRIG